MPTLSHNPLTKPTFPGYYQFLGHEGQPYGSFEIWECDGSYFWWPCFPGCLPDGDPEGPFSTPDEAWQHAQAGA